MMAVAPVLGRPRRSTPPRPSSAPPRRRHLTDARNRSVASPTPSRRPATSTPHPQPLRRQTPPDCFVHVARVPASPSPADPKPRRPRFSPSLVRPTASASPFPPVAAHCTVPARAPYRARRAQASSYLWSPSRTCPVAVLTACADRAVARRPPAPRSPYPANRPRPCPAPLRRAMHSGVRRPVPAPAPPGACPQNFEKVKRNEKCICKNK